MGARFLPDGKHVIFVGIETGHAARVYLLDVESGATKPITPEGVTGGPRSPATRTLSPDGKYVVVRSKGAWFKWPLEGGDPIPIAGLNDDDIVISWSGDGKQLYVGRPEEFRPRRIYLFDIATQKRTLWKSLGPQNWTGASSALIPSISREGKRYAYPREI